MKRHADRPLGPDLVYTALQELCPDCGRRLPIYQVDGRRVQGLDFAFYWKLRDKRCRPDCPGHRPIFHAPRDLRVVLPHRIYGLDVTVHVGVRHLPDKVPLARIASELHGRQVLLDQRHTGRVFRDFVALSQLAAGDDEAVRQRLRAQGGMVLMCDGVQFDNRSAVLYLVWDALSGTPLYGERKDCRGQQDLVPLLERARAMGVAVIGVVTDKEKGLVAAVEKVFAQVPYQFCQTHFLKNCALPLQQDLAELQASVRRRAEAVREVGRQLSEAATEPAGPARTEQPVRSNEPVVVTAAMELASADSRAHEPGSTAETNDDAPALTEEGLARQVCELVRVNSRVSGKAPLDPAELGRHERLEQIRGLVNTARKKEPAGEGQDSWPLLDQLAAALAPSWSEARTAGRVRRHTEILRAVAHELSGAPDRPDRPGSAAEAQSRFERFLADLDILTPRAGLGAPTGQFIDALTARYGRYGAHLFQCFDDPRIPATTNGLEGFFGQVKQGLRHALGCGATTNSVVTNLGAEALIAYQQVRCPRALERLRTPSCSAQEFRAARARLAAKEAPAIRQRSMARHLGRHLCRLRRQWLKPPTAPDAYA
jgi:hypothetical protein